MKIRRVISTILFVFLIVSQISAIDESRVKEYYLDNGLKVILYEMHNAPVIFSNLTYNVGSKYEPYGKTGISHVVEHMMFKGTKRFPKGTISGLISANGGVFNAYTTTDRTVYYELLPKNKIELALDIESERMYKCEFDPAEFSSEIKVIMEERRMRTDNSAAGQLREELNTILYKSHPYRNPVIGWMEDLREMTRDDAFEYYNTYYTPNNATLVLVGDFKLQDMLEKVKHFFGRIPKGKELPEIKFHREELRGKRILEFSHPDLDSRSVRYYFQAPPRISEDGAALYVGLRILGRKSVTSRLYKRLVNEERLCSSTGSGFGFRKDPGYFSIGATLVSQAQVDTVEKIIWEEIDSIKTHPVSDYELRKEINTINFTEITENQTSAEIGNQLALYESYGSWKNINLWRDLIKNVTAEDIQTVMKKYVTPENYVICYLSPDTSCSEEDKLADENMKRGENIDSSLELKLPEVEDDKARNSEKGIFSFLFKKKDGDVWDLYKPTFETIIKPNPIKEKVDSLSLQNGAKVYFIEQHDFPTFFLMGFIKTGRIEENRDKPGIRKFVMSMLPRGTKHHDYNQINELASFTPFSFQIDQSWNSITFQGYSLVSDADSLLQILYEILTEPAFPEDEIEKIRPLLVEKAENFMSSERMKAFFGMYNEVFTDHQYGVSYAGEPEVYQTITRDELINYWDRYISPDSLVLVAVGDFDRDWLRNNLSYNFGLWNKRSKDPHLPFEIQQPIKGKKIIVYTNPEYKQCRVDLAFNPVEGGINWYIDDLPALEILDGILCKSSLTSRMGKKLRDDQGLCYSIKSNLWIRKNGGYWNIRTHVDRENIRKMIDGMMSEIRRIQEQGVTEDELRRIKSRYIALLPLQIRTADDMGVMLYDGLKKYNRIDYFDSLREKYLAVTAEDVRQAAVKYLDTENYIIAVSGNVDETELSKYGELVE